MYDRQQFSNCSILQLQLYSTNITKANLTGVYNDTYQTDRCICVR